jgi:hypothetical protein
MFRDRNARNRYGGSGTKEIRLVRKDKTKKRLLSFPLPHGHFNAIINSGRSDHHELYSANTSERWACLSCHDSLLFG